MKSLTPRVLTATFAMALIVLFSCVPVLAAPSNTRSSGRSSAQGEDKADGDIRVSFIDVGKGDCALVQAGDKAVLIDAGYDNTSSTVTSYLRSQGVEHLDHLILTHYDRDHVGGLSAIAKAFDVNAVHLPNYEGADKNYNKVMTEVKRLGLKAVPVTKTQSIRLEDAQLDIYPSKLKYVIEPGEDEGNDNDLSLVTALTYRNDSYLFAGDLEEEGIEAYLAAKHGHYDVLKMPHHGDKADNNEDFLDDVSPKIVVITDSKADPASKKTLKLFDKSGVTTYRTATDGTIVIKSDGTGRYSVE